jgi:UDP-2,3-diacylglucosamine pyrophosphatase LpxH
MLAEPFRYQDYVKKFLDGIEEEEEQKQPRKRTRSSTFLGKGHPHLPEINEEETEHKKEYGRPQPAP